MVIDNIDAVENRQYEVGCTSVWVITRSVAVSLRTYQFFCRIHDEVISYVMHRGPSVTIGVLLGSNWKFITVPIIFVPIRLFGIPVRTVEKGAQARARKHNFTETSAH